MYTAFMKYSKLTWKIGNHKFHHFFLENAISCPYLQIMKLTKNINKRGSK